MGERDASGEGSQTRGREVGRHGETHTPPKNQTDLSKSGSPYGATHFRFTLGPLGWVVKNIRLPQPWL